MNTSELIEATRDVMGVRRVFGEAYEKNGVTVIPAAWIRGGLGAGEGEGTDETKGSGKGAGGGFGVTAKPAGVYVIDGTKVRWQPAVDVNRVIFGCQIVAIVALLVLRAIRRR
jgi:uncharacterized spore protein YtfJ